MNYELLLSIGYFALALLSSMWLILLAVAPLFESMINIVGYVNGKLLWPIMLSVAWIVAAKILIFFN